MPTPKNKLEGLQEEIQEKFGVKVEETDTDTGMDMESVLDLGSNSSQIDQKLRLSEIPRHRIQTVCKNCDVPIDECVETPTSCPIIRGLPTQEVVL